jgi:hypothetical protein
MGTELESTWLTASDGTLSESIPLPGLPPPAGR